ncbi:hypothetical protein DOTSEDRAFT_77383 [Dothistroma septosporum NZE10]|uniref:Mid2 domain-containing protein n=1 Tax=Dothistroma septosporum (strain NZE10 / CBS 128990) TaxID=675120 RepID=N1Q5C3_DOTSN|nr:hypothetical protein DOTSEDRAFT_77383 [Dothistroma septosporum NZE10]
MKLSLYLWLCAIGTLTSALAIDQVDANGPVARQETASQTAAITSTAATASSTATSNDPDQTDQPSSGIYGSSSSQGGNTDAGASGSGSSFNLSTGGLVAIIIVVVAVVAFGVATTTLWVIAKRRQWTMKQTLKRASKRLTGRGGPRQDARDAADERRRRRTGVQMTSREEQRGAKRGMVIEIKDQEDVKGERSAGGGLGSKLWRNDWKR